MYEAGYQIPSVYSQLPEAVLKKGTLPVASAGPNAVGIILQTPDAISCRLS